MPVPNTWLLADNSDADPNNWATLQSIIGEADIPIEVDDSYFPQSVFSDNGDGSRTAHGFIKVIWRFKITRVSQRQALRAFCPGLSASVYLRTQTNEYDPCLEEREWINLSGTMLWMTGDEMKNGQFTEEIEIEFRACAEVV